MSQVSEALFRLGDNLRRGFQDEGDRTLKGAELGLRRARQRFDIGRLTKADERAEALSRQRQDVFESGAPGRELQTQRDQETLELRNTPVTAARLFPNQEALGFAFSKGVGGKEESFVSKFQTQFGGTFDTTESSETFGQLISNDTGQPITMGEIEARGPEVEALFSANIGVGHLIRSTKRSIDRALQSGQIDQEQHSQGIEDLKQRNTPQGRIQMREEQLRRLAPFNQKWAVDAKARIRTGIEKDEERIFKISERVAKTETPEQKLEFTEQRERRIQTVRQEFDTPLKTDAEKLEFKRKELELKEEFKDRGEKEFAPSNLGKLISERSQFPIGSPERIAYNDLIETTTSRDNRPRGVAGEFFDIHGFVPNRVQLREFKEDTSATTSPALPILN